jgi:hypothetical protein
MKNCTKATYDEHGVMRTDMDTDFDSGFFRPPDLMHWFCPWFVPFTLSGHTDFDYWVLRLKWGSQLVLFVNRRILLVLGTWSHLWYVRGSVLGHLFLWLIIPSYVPRLFGILTISFQHGFSQYYKLNKCCSTWQVGYLVISACML